MTKRSASTWGLQRSGVDPPLCSSRACLHTAFIAISVPLQCDSRLLASDPLCRSLSSLNGVGMLGSLVLGALMVMQVMEFGGLSLGGGVDVVFHCGSSCDLGGRAFAGHTRPLAVLTLVTKGRRVRGKDEVRGQPSRSLSPILASLWVLRIEKPQWVQAFLS